MVFTSFLSSFTMSTLIFLGHSDLQWNSGWNYRNRKCMTAGGGRQDGTHLRHPVAFRSTCEECSCIFLSSWRGEFSQPEWGIITALVNTARVSWMIGILSASQDERFQRTPARHTYTELWDGHSCFLLPKVSSLIKLTAWAGRTKRVWAHVLEHTLNFRTRVRTHWRGTVKTWQVGRRLVLWSSLCHHDE